METTKLKLVLSEPDVAIPDTGRLTGSTSALQNTVTVVAIVAVLIIVATIVGVAIHRSRKVKKVRFFTPIFLILGLLSGIVAPVLTNNRTFAAAIYDEIKGPEEVSMKGVITESTFIFGKATLTMLHAYDHEIYLGFSANEANFVPKTENNETKIVPIEKESKKLTANTYGFTLKEGAKATDEVWLSPDETVLIDSIPSDNYTVDVYFGILTDDTVLADTYELDVKFQGDIYGDLDILPNIRDLTYMQEFKNLTDSERFFVAESMALEEQYQLKDIRDGKTYYIAKLKDGNIWMTQNLDHDIVTDENYYTPENTDVPENWTAGGATHESNDITWLETFDMPESYDPGDICWNGTVKDDNSDATIPCTNANANQHYSIGNYYNWAAAVAMNNIGDLAENNYVANQSICPAGWTLPLSGNNEGSGSFAYLVNSYSAELESGAKPWESPVYFSLAGVWNGAASISHIYSIGQDGTFWSGVNTDDTFAYVLLSRDLNQTYYAARSYGYSVRCVMRQK